MCIAYAKPLTLKPCSLKTVCPKLYALNGCRLDQLTRLVNCTDVGCRVEVWHMGAWGRVNGVWLNQSAHVACRSVLYYRL